MSSYPTLNVIYGTIFRLRLLRFYFYVAKILSLFKRSKIGRKRSKVEGEWAEKETGTH